MCTWKFLIRLSSPELYENVVLTCAGMFPQMVTILNEVAKKHVLVIAQACASLCTDSSSHYKLVNYSVSCRQSKELLHTLTLLQIPTELE